MGEYAQFSSSIRRRITTKLIYSSHLMRKIIVASTENLKVYGEEVTFEFDESLTIPENHRNAASKLQEKLAWSGTLLKWQIVNEETYQFEVL